MHECRDMTPCADCALPIHVSMLAAELTDRTRSASTWHQYSRPLAWLPFSSAQLSSAQLSSAQLSPAQLSCCRSAPPCCSRPSPLCSSLLLALQSAGGTSRWPLVSCVLSGS